VPRITKIVINIGIGEAKDNARALEAAVGDVRTITGQQPIVVKARKSVAAFKLRTGMPVGIKATLRGRRMWYFLEKLVQVALPRIRDFRGVSADGFDGRGNYSLGLREQIVFPEVDYDKIDKLRGLEVSIVTTARTDEEARSLLRRLGMPFRQEGR
jgi:large subunit ribosomal protein L5